MSARAGVAIATIAVVLGCRVPRAIRPQPVDAPLPPEVMAEARDYYVRDCAPCHGSDGKGNGPEAKALRFPPPDLTHMAARAGGAFPRDRFVATLTGELDVPAHAREMPVWQRRYGGSGPAGVAAVYAQRRIDLLADYVASLQAKPGKR